jgi:phage baseplate assembly protein W
VRKDFLGRGWRFPFQFDAATGSVSYSEYEENIRQCITIILATKPGERQMMPDFGCRAHELMFAPAVGATGTAIAYHVQRALERWEPRIEVLSVDAVPDLHGPMRVSVTYKVKSTNQAQEISMALNSGG